MSFKKNSNRPASVKRKSVLMYRGREPSNSEKSLRDYAAMEADLIVIDESNSFSENQRGLRKYLTIVCSRTTDYRKFANVANQIPITKGQRKKHWNMRPSEIDRIIEEIEKFTETELIITEEHRYINYRNLTESKAKNEFYMDLLGKAIENIVKVDSKKAMIIIIDNPPLDIYNELWELGIKLQSLYPNISWLETSLSSGTKVLQTHDIITGVIADHIEQLPDREATFLKLKKYLKK